MEPGCSSSINHDRVQLSETCFNCHSQLKPVLEPRVLTLGHAGGVKVNNDVFSFSEALIYIFELDSSQAGELRGLNIDEMALCDFCYELLVNIYSYRQTFLQLTNTHSCVYNILNKSDEISVIFDSTEATATKKAAEQPVYELADEDEDEDEADDPEADDDVKEFEEFEVEEFDPDQFDELDPLEMVIVKTESEAVDADDLLCHESLSTSGESQDLDLHDLKEEPVKQIQIQPWPCLPKITDERRSVKRVRVRVTRLRSKITQRADTVSVSPTPRNNPTVMQDSTWPYQVNHVERLPGCEICGNPRRRTHFARKIHRHSHLSEEEKLALPPAALREIERNVMRLKEKYSRYRKEAKTAACPECGKILKSQEPKHALRKHMSVVHPHRYQANPLFICDICGKPSRNCRGMNEHRISHMNAEERLSLTPKPRLLCHECGASFKEPKGLRQHISQAHEKRPKRVYICEKCGQSTTCHKTHRNHLRVHEIEAGDKYFYFCEKCPMKFKLRMEKYKHGGFCTGEAAKRPHQCPEEGCGRRFRFRTDMERHRLNKKDHQKTLISEPDGADKTGEEEEASTSTI